MKRSLIYLLIVSVLAIAVIALEGVRSYHGADTNPFLPKLMVGDVARIDVEKMVSGVSLVKDGDKWTAKNVQTKLAGDIAKNEGGALAPVSEAVIDVDAKKVENALTMLPGLLVGGAVSADPKKFDIFQVSGLLGAHVKLFNAKGDVLADFYIGKNATSFMDVYVRKEGEDKIYEVKAFLGGAFSPSPDGWKVAEPPSSEEPKTPDKSTTSE